MTTNKAAYAVLSMAESYDENAIKAGIGWEHVVQTY